jgi:hypothetical protein
MRRFLGRGPPSVALDMFFLSHLRQRRIQSDGSALSPGSTSSHRGSLLNVLFVHREASVVDCLQALGASCLCPLIIFTRFVLGGNRLPERWNLCKRGSAR